MKRKIEEPLKMKEAYEIEIASLKSKAEKEYKISKEKEMIKQGDINSLEEEMKVLVCRVNRFKEAVPKLTEELKEVRKAAPAKDKSGPNTSKAEINNLKKALKDSEDKVEKVTIEKVEFEKEAKMMARMNSNLEQVLAMMKGKTEGTRGPDSPSMSSIVSTATAAATGDLLARGNIVKRKGKCYKFEKGQCRSENCGFLHPEEVCKLGLRQELCVQRAQLPPAPQGRAQGGLLLLEAGELQVLGGGVQQGPPQA